MIDPSTHRPELVSSLRGAMRLYHAETEQHLRRVRSVAEILALAARLPPDQIGMLTAAAILHDLGKLAIDRELLARPGPLTSDEWIELKRHSEIGADVLTRLAEPLRPAAVIIRSHHERWDGNGYPDGLVGNQIPVAARIIAIADTLDALTHRRSYRPDILSVDEALGVVQFCAASQFDPTLVDILKARHETSPGELDSALTGRDVVAGDRRTAAFRPAGA